MKGFPMKDEVELITIPGNWNFDYRYFAGETASRFFAELKHSRRIMGTRCGKCRRLLVPARTFCEACYVETVSWEPVGEEGTLEVFTIVSAAFPGMPPPPFVIGYVTLDGADTSIANFIKGVDLSDIQAAGSSLLSRPRVRTVFRAEGEGRITDFHFELLPVPARGSRGEPAR